MVIRSIAVSAGILLIVSGAYAADVEPVKRAESFEIKGAVEHPKTIALADLQKEPAITEDITQHTGKGPMTGKFTGVPLWTLLQEAGIKTTQGLKNEMIRHTVLITAVDGYTAVLSTGELDPEFAGEKAIIAYTKDGKPLDDRYGFARLIIQGDKSAGRSISGIVSIEVR